MITLSIFIFASIWGTWILFGSPLQIYKSLRSGTPALSIFLPLLLKAGAGILTNKYEVEDLVKLKPWGYNFLKKLSFVLGLYRIVPFMFGWGITIKYGADKLWKFPFDRYVIWDWALLLTAYIEINHSRPIVGVLVSVIIISTNIISIFVIDNSLSTQPHKFGLIRGLANGVTVILSYGILYFSLDKICLNFYSRNFANQTEAMFFSFNQASFGQSVELTAISTGAKFLVLSESFFAFSFAAIFLAVYIPEWRDAKRKLHLQIEVSK